MREYDQHITNIRNLASQNKSIPLAIPNKIGHEGALGRSVSLAQMVTTWAKLSPMRNIHTWLRSDEEDVLENFVGRIHGLSAAYFADKVFDAGKKTDLRKTLLTAAKNRVDAMHRRELNHTAKGILCELIFVRGARKEFHSAVYTRKPTPSELKDSQSHGELIVDSREMNSLLFSILGYQLRQKHRIKRIESILDREEPILGQVLHEVFRNTAEHAYPSIPGEIPQKSMRCILVSTHHIDPRTISAKTLTSADHPKIDDYFIQIYDRVKNSDRNLFSVLELSIFDTGPGFVNTIRDKMGKDADDKEAVLNCFRDHITSKGGPNSGLGLGRVLSHVQTLNGFFRVRTSTAEAFYSGHVERHNNMHLEPTVMGNLPEVEGTVFTIAFPLVL